MYAGSMFCSSLDGSLQGKAIAAVEAKWGFECESVCKARYQPYRVCPVTGKKEPMYGCNNHHPIRFLRIAQYGPRPGWVPFSQWHGSQSYGSPSSKKGKKRPRNNGDDNKNTSAATSIAAKNGITTITSKATNGSSGAKKTAAAAADVTKKAKKSAPNGKAAARLKVSSSSSVPSSVDCKACRGRHVAHICGRQKKKKE